MSALEVTATGAAADAVSRHVPELVGEKFASRLFACVAGNCSEKLPVRLCLRFSSVRRIACAGFGGRPSSTFALLSRRANTLTYVNGSVPVLRASWYE